MVEGHIYIKGVIGSQYNESNKLIKKGVDLVDVVEQVSKLAPEVESVICHINSEGGFVAVGNQIHEFLQTLPNLVTIAEELCASIATKVFLAAPLQNRKVVSGCKFMIHNPFIQNASGDAEQLKQAANEIEQIEKELEADYSKATGVSKEAISGLMKVETFFTDEQLLNFKFASEIIPNTPIKAVAILENQNNHKMSKSLKERAASAVMALAKATLTEEQIKALQVGVTPEPNPNENREAKALMIEAEGDQMLETPFADLAINDAVMIDGVEVTDGSKDGSYVTTAPVLLVDGTELPVGSTIVVAGNMVSEIIPFVEQAPDQSAELAELKAQLEAKDAEIVSLKEDNQKVAKDAEEALAIMEKAAKMQSTYTPPVAQATFLKPEKPLSMKEQMEKRKAEYAKR